ncbi:MAG: hypothetical protein ACJ8CB_09655, partial [Ktedonobacteraceae bacterium]
SSLILSSRKDKSTATHNHSVLNTSTAKKPVVLNLQKSRKAINFPAFWVYFVYELSYETTA